MKDRIVQTIQKHPLPALIGGVMLGAVILYFGSGLITGVRQAFQDRQVTQLEQKAAKSEEQSAKSLEQANQEAINRAAEDIVRERTVAPEIQRTSASVATARQRRQSAETNFQRTVESAPPIAPDNPQLKEFTAQLGSAKELINAQSKEIKELDSRLKAEEANSLSLYNSYEGAKRESKDLREAVKAKDEAIAAKNETIAVLTSQRDEARKDAKKWKKRAAIVTVGAAIFGILKF